MIYHQVGGQSVDPQVFSCDKDTIFHAKHASFPGLFLCADEPGGVPLFSDSETKTGTPIYEIPVR
jgi:hypothetical protein